MILRVSAQVFPISDFGILALIVMLNTVVRWDASSSNAAVHVSVLLKAGKPSAILFSPQPLFSACLPPHSFNCTPYRDSHRLLHLSIVPRLQYSPRPQLYKMGNGAKAQQKRERNAKDAKGPASQLKAVSTCHCLPSLPWRGT